MSLRSEISLHKAKSTPSSVRFGRFCRWRWDVTFYRPTESVLDSCVYDAREHQGNICGYSFTKVTALLQIEKAIRNYKKACRVNLDSWR